MKQEKKVRYYIGKKQYVPEESDMLCSVQHDSFGNETAQKLYRTGKGSFFLVSMNGNSKAKGALPGMWSTLLEKTGGCRRDFP